MAADMSRKMSTDMPRKMSNDMSRKMSTESSGDWATSLRPVKTPQRRSSVAETPDALTKTDSISRRLSGQHTYSRAKAIADEVERMQREMMKIGEEEKECKVKEPIPEVYIPSDPRLTSGMSLEAQCVRSIEYEEAIETLLSEGKLRVTDPALVSRWESRRSFQTARNDDEKRQLLKEDFDLCEQVLSMYRAELERLSQ